MARFAITMLLALLAALCAPAWAHPPVVSKLADTNDGLCDADCSLREAIDDALSGETITFAEEVVGTSTLSLGALLIDGTTAIAGPGRERLTISGGDAQRIFRITTTGTLTASGLTFAHAKGEYYAPLGSAAGGVVLNSGSFDISDCAFIDNHADGRTGTVNNDAAAIYSDAANKTISLTRCTFENNTAAAGACLDIDGGRLIIRDSTFTGNVSSLGVTSGVIANSRDRAIITGSTFNDNWSMTGGALWVSGSGGATVENCTFNRNSGGLYGGAVYVWSSLSMNGVTLSGNDAATGKNVYVAAGAALTVTNTIFADTASNCAGTGTITSLGHNLDSGATCRLYGPGDLVNTPAELAPLADNGGPTKTMALTPCSPAVDTGSDTTCLEAGQRGIERPQGGHCDIGAYEWVQVHPFTASFCLDKKRLGWGAEPGASSYDVAVGRTSQPGLPFDGDFSAFRTPYDTAGCAASCDLTSRIYDTFCTGVPGAGLLEMWVVRSLAPGYETWDEGGSQVGTRDDPAGSPNPQGIPRSVVCP